MSKVNPRVDVVLELLVAGLSRRQILANVEQKHAEWHASQRTIDRYIAMAYGILEQEAKPIRAREIAKALRRLDMLFARSLAITDFKACLAIQRERNTLLWLYETGAPQEQAKATELRIIRPNVEKIGT